MIRRVAALTFLASLAPPAGAAGVVGRAVRVDVPSATLRDAVVAFGVQAGVTVGLPGAALAQVRVRAVRGRMAPAEALRRMLRGTAATFVQVGAASFRIVPRATSPRPASVVPPPPVAPAPDEDVVVTATKRVLRLVDYPGSVVVADASFLRPGQTARGTAALVERLPILSSTNLGPGRNKLFIRGVADSSFSGPTQATVGQYLGDVRLNYSAPDPNLALHDVQSIEVLEGPQGTLYGAGSLGGIIRLLPNAPDLTRAAGSLEGGATATRRGAAGGDAAGVVNLPLIGDRLGVRAVGYLSRDGGYIDDPGRGTVDINRTETRGARATIRFRPSDAWTVDLGGVMQDINSRDGQYAERGLPPLQRVSAIPQPFDNDYALGSLTVRLERGRSTLTSISSIVSHDLTTVFDATVNGNVRTYREAERIMLVSNETRLARRTDTGGWLVGFEVLHSDDRFSRALGPPASPAVLPGTRNEVSEASGFGEYTRSLTSRLSATVGARVVFNRLVAEARQDPDAEEEPDRSSSSVLPSLGLLWTPRPRLALFARYQEGFRPGGLSAGETTTRFESDTVSSVELGFRFGTLSDVFSASATVSRLRWEDIQADLVGTTGLPFIANVGSGHVLGFEAQAAWRLSPAIVLDGAVFLDGSGLEQPAAGYATDRGDSLPNVASTNLRGGVRAELPVGGRRLTASASIRYVGRSRLGVGPLLDLDQGRYVDTALGATLPLGRIALSLDVTNLLDERGNVFSLGNPFTVSDGRQVTPLRPRTVRLGARIDF